MPNYFVFWTLNDDMEDQLNNEYDVKQAATAKEAAEQMGKIDGWYYVFNVSNREKFEVKVTAEPQA